MAVTIISQPSEPSFAYMPVVWSASSNNVDIVRMKCDVYAGDEYSTLLKVATIYQDYDIDSTVFSFDVASVCRDNMSHKLIDIDSSCIFVDDYQGHKWFRCTITEIIESSSGLLEEAQNANTGTRDVVNATGTFKELANYNPDDYLADYVSMKAFLTSYPSNTGDAIGSHPQRYKEIGLDENEFLGFGIAKDTNGGFPFDDMEITVIAYDDNFTHVLTYHSPSIDASISSGSGMYTKSFLYIPCGTANLAASGVDLSSVKYYRVSITNITQSSNPSQEFGYKIVDRCSHGTRIHWQNKYGKTDSYTFEGRKVYGMESKNENATKVLQNGFTSKDTGVFSFNTSTNEVYTVWTKAIGREELSWITEITFNNRAFIEIDKKYYPIIIEDSEYDIIDSEDVVFQFRLSFKIANNIKGLQS